MSRTPLPRLIRYAPRSLFVAMVLLIGISAGCQERVISENYAPMTGMNASHPYTSRTPAPTTRPKRKSWLDQTVDGTGELLFGWTRHLAPKPQPQPPSYRTTGPAPYTTTLPPE